MKVLEIVPCEILFLMLGQILFMLLFAKSGVCLLVEAESF